MVNASLVNTKVTAMVAQDNGKLKAAPSIVSVTDSCNAFLSIFIKKLFQVFIYTCTRKGWSRGGNSISAYRIGVPLTCCVLKGEREHNIFTPFYSLLSSEDCSEERNCSLLLLILTVSPSIIRSCAFVSIFLMSIW